MFHTQLGCVYVIYVCIPVTLKTGTEILLSWMNITQISCLNHGGLSLGVTFEI